MALSNAERQKKYRESQKIVTTVTDSNENVTRVTENVNPVTDAEILNGWARGEGNVYQQGLGHLSATYTKVKIGSWPVGYEVPEVWKSKTN